MYVVSEQQTIVGITIGYCQETILKMHLNLGSLYEASLRSLKGPANNHVCVQRIPIQCCTCPMESHWKFQGGGGGGVSKAQNI